jgi:hypothetical protein
VAKECGIDGAVYSYNGIAHEPTLLCACGKSFSGIDWAEAGALYDEHLRVLGAPPKPKKTRRRK